MNDVGDMQILVKSYQYQHEINELNALMIVFKLNNK